MDCTGLHRPQTSCIGFVTPVTRSLSPIDPPDHVYYICTTFSSISNRSWLPNQGPLAIRIPGSLLQEIGSSAQSLRPCQRRSRRSSLARLFSPQARENARLLRARHSGRSLNNSCASDTQQSAYEVSTDNIVFEATLVFSAPFLASSDERTRATRESERETFFQYFRIVDRTAARWTTVAWVLEHRPGALS